MHGAPFTDHKQSFHPFTRPPWKFLHIRCIAPWEDAGLQPGRPVVSHDGLWTCRKRFIRSFVQPPEFVVSRVRAGDDVLRRCFLDGRDSRCRGLRLVFSEEWTTEDVTRFLLDWCHRLSSFHPVSGLACYTGSSHTGRHPESTATCAPSLRPSVRIVAWSSRPASTKCSRHGALAPKRTTIGNRCVHSSKDLKAFTLLA